MKVGLLSDTHDFLDPKIFELFEGCDEIWHAGDFGDEQLVGELEKFKPLRGVYGNIDTKQIASKFPEDLWFDADGLSVWMTHIAGSPPNYNSRIRKILGTKSVNILICGHSHILKVVKDPTYNLLYLNPGAAGHQGFHHIRTALRFEISAGDVINMEAIELGRRGIIQSL